MRKYLMATVLLPLGLGLAGAVQAQSPNPSSQSSAELFYMIQQLQGEVRRMQGRIEEQQHQITRLQQQGRDRYVDLDQRILDLSRAVDERPAAGTPAPDDTGAGADSNPGSESPQALRVYRSPGAEEKKAYDEIISLIRNDKDYDAAISRLYDFVGTYPEGDLTVNAYYWLGEVYLAKPQPEQAKQAFTIVATRYSDHRKASDAVYKLGVALDRLGEKEEAGRRMQSVVDRYPQSSAAELAQKYRDRNGG